MAGMKQRPILFQGAMVRALLNGTKTQTRRTIKGLTDKMWVEESANGGFNACYDGEPCCGTGVWDVPAYANPIVCPYGQPGDQIMVRETFFAWGRWETRFSAKKGRDEWHFVDMTLECGKAYSYPATDSNPLPMRGKRDVGVMPGWWKRPAIFMPRAACRITLEIVSVRVERLQDISEADSRAEGITDGGCTNCGNSEPCGCAAPAPDARDSYCNLWKSINGDGSWDANPWVWVVEFRRLP